MRLRRDFLATLAGATALRAATIPRPAPEFTFKLLDGSGFNLSQAKGKIAAISFISTG